MLFFAIKFVNSLSVSEKKNKKMSFVWIYKCKRDINRKIEKKLVYLTRTLLKKNLSKKEKDAAINLRVLIIVSHSKFYIKYLCIYQVYIVLY